MLEETVANNLDPDEQEQFAALERLAAERDRETQQAQRELQTPDRRPVDIAVPADSERVEREATRPERKKFRADRDDRTVAEPLVPFISAEAVDQRLRALDERLQQIEAQTRHTMLLTMILADRQRVTAEEYQTAEAKTQRVEQAAKGT